jgi:molybdopterin molybdotransferase
MKLLTVDTIDEARKKLMACASSHKMAREMVPLLLAPDRIAAEDIRAPEHIPAFRRATVDGYAVAAGDTAGAGETLPVFLRYAGSVLIGKAAALSLRRGECAYVPTGGMIPEGADAMVMVEYCESAGAENIAVYKSVAPGAGLVEIGEDCREGDVLIRRGRRIRAQETGALAAAGIQEVPVYGFLTMTIISTGDELAAPGKTPGPGEIRDSNTAALRSLALRSGYRLTASRVIPDDEALLETCIREAMDHSGVVVLSGGSSQGERDFTGAVVSRLARPGILTHGLALKPGKPTIIAHDTETETILVGLPGHPVSAMMVFTLLLTWLSRTLTQTGEAFPIPALLSCNLAGSPGKTTCQPVSLRREGAGYRADPVFGKSGMIRVLTGADGFILIDQNREGLQKDEPVWVYMM